MSKLLENIFRAVNIALVNELAQLCERMDIDVWEVVEAAETKPFGFMSFKPGPGLGGHCIPIDPFYLTWKAREYDFYTEFIELAGKVNAKHAVLLSLVDLAGAEPRLAEVAQGLDDPRPRRLLQGGHRRRARVSAEKIIGLLQKAGQTSHTTTPMSTSSTGCARRRTSPRATTAS